MTTRISREQLAAHIAADIEEGSYVNLGIGAPTLVADYLAPGSEIVLHTENGLLGMGSTPTPDRIDPDLLNAGKQPVTVMPGAAYFHHANSFAMMRGGHLEACVLGAFRSARPAIWRTGRPERLAPYQLSGARWTLRSAPNAYK